MAKVIDPDKLAAGDITDDEYRYLQDRAQLPAHLPFRPDLVHNPKSSDDLGVNTGTVNTIGTTQEDLDALDTIDDDDVPTIKSRGGIQGDEDEDADGEDSYVDGWTNKTRRAELSSRGLSVDGDKDTLVSRLRRSDSDQLTEEDYA